MSSATSAPAAVLIASTIASAVIEPESSTSTGTAVDELVFTTSR